MCKSLTFTILRAIYIYIYIHNITLPRHILYIYTIIAIDTRLTIHVEGVAMNIQERGTYNNILRVYEAMLVHLHCYTTGYTDKASVILLCTTV